TQVVQQHGITSFKVFMAYKGAIMVDDGELYQVMKQAAKLGAVVTVHCENGDAVWHLQKELVAGRKLGPEDHPGSGPSSVEGEAAAPGRRRLHRAHALWRGGGGARARQACGPALLRRALPAVSAARRQGVQQARLRRLRLRDEPADPARAPRPPRCAVARTDE